jgi:hypothetical protein
MVIDGEVEVETRFSATGLAPSLTQLSADGRRITPSRTLYRPDTIATPFYAKPGQIIEAQ